MNPYSLKNKDNDIIFFKSYKPIVFIVLSLNLQSYIQFPIYY